MKPLLAHVYEPHRVTYPCYIQPKLNGIRALYQAGRFQSRDELPFPPGLLEHLACSLRAVFDERIILDGELYVHGWTLQRINGAVTPVRQQPTKDTLKVEYHVFDVVDFGKSFFERQLIRQHGHPIHVVETYRIESEETANRFYDRFVTFGYEGMMYRLGDCPYTRPKQERQEVSITEDDYGIGRTSRTKFLSDKDNRCWHLLKRKDFQDDEFLITGFNETTGEKGERGFQLHLLAKNGQPFKAGGGLTHSEVDHYLEHSPVGRQAKVKYLVLSEGGIPTGNPTILAIL